MKEHQPSATAYLVAESAVLLSKNPLVQTLLQPGSIELSRYFADSRRFKEKILYLAKQKFLLRPVFNALENFVLPGIQLHYTVRKRRLEEIALAALGDNFEQIVVFGAGFDTLALRLHTQFPDVHFVEIDHPATQKAKTIAVEKKRMANDNLKFIALDIGRENSFDELSKNEIFYKNVKTLFIAEGLLMYLTEAENKKLFGFINRFSKQNSRFAFTFMQRQPSGRIAFRNSSKLVDLWLKKRGEPFRWSLGESEIESFLSERDFSLENLDNAKTFRRRYLTSPELSKLSLAEGESLCLASVGKKQKIYVNDVHSKLNRTEVAEIIKPTSAAEIQNAVKRAKSELKNLSVAGGFHAMGGQQFLSGGILLDMSAMNCVLKFEPERELIEVESGIKWNALVDYTIAAQTGKSYQVGIRQKQTGADSLSIGGALSANIHGRGLQMKPFIEDIESFRLINADGEIVNCSRLENTELFRLAVGGYGLFGIILSVKLRLTKRQKLERVVKIETVENLSQLFTEKIKNGFLFGDFQFAIASESDDFLKKGVFSCYRPVSNAVSMTENQTYELAADDWKNLLLFAHVDKQKAFDLYAAHYLKTDGQIYHSDTHQLGVYLDDYHSELDEITGAKNRGSEMITEVFVPLEKLADFLEVVRQDFRRRNVNLIYGTIRLIKRDTESFLAWAQQDFACVVFNLHVEHDTPHIEKAKKDFRRLIERAISFGGSFYLTYHRWAHKKQILDCYPQMPKFLRLKKKYDESEVFQSDWYNHLKEELSNQSRLR
ncbi:MAG: SAM-dependent methyltransferase [Acidobacteriota bacterium]